MISNETRTSIPDLKDRIQLAVKTIGDDKSNVFEHIRKNSLISKLKRLDKISSILEIQKYRIVFIGTIGAGKTTAICHLFNLIHDIDKAVEINKKKRTVNVTEPLLSTGSGRTTISEVIIRSDEKIYIEIDPYSKEKLEFLINDFCESFYNNKPEGEVISIEIERALRSITNLKKIQKKNKDKNGMVTSKTIDMAKEKAKEIPLEELKRYAFENLEWSQNLYVFGIIAFGIGCILAGIFSEDPKGFEESVSGKIHGIASGVGFIFLICNPLWATFIDAFSKYKAWNIFLFGAGIVTFSVFIISENIETGLLRYTGLFQRLNLIVLYACLILNFTAMTTKGY